MADGLPYSVGNCLGDGRDGCKFEHFSINRICHRQQINLCTIELMEFVLGHDKILLFQFRTAKINWKFLAR
ncbi:hypothetical protein RB2150_08268 [Rhodobacterales bacterium HTCC2150]|nr:hypothetical protein RB2150_08268 [Rhodobacterales bacterium HTCC2150] [Rhodobacteraceae bacterium HTCC2150]